MRGRTVREFTCRTDLWPLVDSWAAETGFTPLQTEDSRRLYRKRGRLFMAPAFVEIRREGRNVTVAAWVKADFFLILNLLSGEKPESGIASGGLTAAIPRKRARQAVNLLLQKLASHRFSDRVPVFEAPPPLRGTLLAPASNRAPVRNTEIIDEIVFV